MRTVAERTVTTVLAAAEIDRGILLGSVGSRGETGSLVGTITEGLRSTLTAGAPVVGLAGFDGDRDGGFLSDDGFGHGMRKLRLRSCFVNGINFLLEFSEKNQPNRSAEFNR